MAQRTPGLSAFSRNTLRASQYANHGTQLRNQQQQSLQTQLEVFQSLLHQFSVSHAKDIRSNPSFRAEFARMCTAIGVDPLVSSSKKTPDGQGVWGKLLGGVGSVNNFWFELGVRVVEVCRETRDENGGMIAVSEIQQRVQKGRGIGGGMEVSEDDILRAVHSLEPLGSGFTDMKIGSKTMIRSVPKELNVDQSTVLEAIQLLGYVTVSMLIANLQWGRARAVSVLRDLQEDSLVWVDLQAEEIEYWSPASIQEIMSSQ